MDFPGFVWLLSHSSWFCLASTTRLILMRNGAEHRILYLLLNSLHGLLLLLFFSTHKKDSLLVFCSFFPTTPGFVWLPQLT